MNRYLITIALCAFVATSLSACFDSDQLASRSSKRPDVAPYMGANNGFVTKDWTPGDKLSWQEAINKRNQNQTEYSRIK